MIKDWIDNNIQKMMDQIMSDVRYKRPLPTSINLHGVALKKFIAILKSKSAFFPDDDGHFKFLNVPVYANNDLPFGSFVVERFKPQRLLEKA